MQLYYQLWKRLVFLKLKELSAFSSVCTFKDKEYFQLKKENLHITQKLFEYLFTLHWDYFCYIILHCFVIVAIRWIFVPQFGVLQRYAGLLFLLMIRLHNSLNQSISRAFFPTPFLVPVSGDCFFDTSRIILFWFVFSTCDHRHWTKKELGTLIFSSIFNVPILASGLRRY